MELLKFVRAVMDQKMYTSRLKSLKLFYRIYSEEEIHRCVICGKYTFGIGHICCECGWECDPVYEDDWDDDSAANHTTVNSYRETYRRVGKGHPIEDYWEAQQEENKAVYQSMKGEDE